MERNRNYIEITYLSLGIREILHDSLPALTVCIPCLVPSAPFFFYFTVDLFRFGCLGLCCSAQAFSSCGKGLLIAVAPLVAEHRLWGSRASVAAACGLSCLEACGIFLHQGSDPCPLRWQVDS